MRAIMIVFGLACSAFFNAAFAGELAQKPQSLNFEAKPPLERRLQLAPYSSEHALTRAPQGQEQSAPPSSTAQELPSVSYKSNECGTGER